MTAPRKVLTEEEIMDRYDELRSIHGDVMGRYSFNAGIALALAAAEKREALWRELAGLVLRKSWSDCDQKRFDELCETLAVDGSPMYATDNGN